MKYIFLFLLMAFISLSRADETVLLSSDKPDLANFSVYGTWLDQSTGDLQITKAPTGIEISGNATARGGMKLTQNLKVGNGQVLHIELFPEVGNKAHAINILLEDNNGAQVGWRFDISNLPQGQPSSLVANNLANPDFVNIAGSKDKLDLQNITGWHLQGDYSSDDPVKVMVTKLSISNK